MLVPLRTAPPWFSNSRRKQSSNPLFNKGRKRENTLPLNPPWSGGPPPSRGWTSLNAPQLHILMHIRGTLLKDPLPLMRSPPERRIRSKFCNYHCDHGHTANNCNQLSSDIEELIHRGIWSNILARVHPFELEPEGVTRGTLGTSHYSWHNQRSSDTCHLRRPAAGGHI